MNKKTYILFLLLIVVLVIFKFWSKSTVNEDLEVKSHAQLPRDQILVIGTVGEVPSDEIEEYQPFIDYVASKLAPQGIKKGEVVVAQSPAEMSKFMRQGKVDMYIDSPFPVYIVSKLAEAKVLVNRWKKGEEKYHSIIFTKKSSGIKTLNDLKGKVIAFESPYSTSGYFLPKSELIKRGFKLKEKKSESDVIGPDEIGYYFTNDQGKVTEDVLSGKAVAGAQNQKDVMGVSGKRYSDLNIVFQSIDVFRHVIVTRKDLPDNLLSDIKKMMTSMHESEEGQRVLGNFSKTTKLGSFDNPTQAFEGVAELSALVENEIVRQ